MNLLLDYKAEIAYRTVARVVLLGRKDVQEPGQDWDLAKTVLIRLLEPRARERAASSALPEVS